MIPVILAGGHGLRLWPISEKKKPFYRFFQWSFLEMSLKRLNGPPPLLVTLDGMKQQTKKIAGSKLQLVCEPESKNTAPAIALACHFLQKQKKEKEIVGFFPVDHYFHPEEKFHQMVSFGERLALSEKQIVTFGITPSKPLPGYGYIKTKKFCYKENDISVYEANSFLEKPDTWTAQNLIQKRNSFWNSGIFISSVDLLIEHFKKFLPEIWRVIETIPEESPARRSHYKNIKAISFDKGIMEKVSGYLVLKTDINWRDLGSWDDIADLHEEENMELGSSVSALSKDSKGNFIFSEKNKPIGLIGVNNHLIINGSEGLLIAKRGAAQGIREIIDGFKSIGGDNQEKEKFPFVTPVLTPWGRYETLFSSLSFKVKLLYIKPKERISCQSHQRRREHWIVVSGRGEVTLNTQAQKIKAEDYIVVPQGEKHRLKNTGKKELVVLEAQFGDPCIEEDITRHEDDYNR